MEPGTNSRKPIEIFVHIPRSAGTTLWSIIWQVYGHKPALRIQAGDTPENTRVFSQMLVNGEEQRYRLVGGHFNLCADLVPPYPHRYFTMLRRPADRAISVYYKAIRRKEHRHHQEFVEGNVGLEAGIERLRHNLQTRFLANVPDAEEATRAHLEVAKHNLENHIDVVGITEYFDESLVLYRQAFNWSLPGYAIRNSGANRPRELPQHVYDLANEINALDVELYDFGLALFQARIAAQGENFQRELAQFRSSLWRSRVQRVRSWLTKKA